MARNKARNKPTCILCKTGAIDPTVGPAGEDFDGVCGECDVKVSRHSRLPPNYPRGTHYSPMSSYADWVREYIKCAPPATQRSVASTPTPSPTPATDSLESAVYAFFTQPRPGNCACNIPRGQCRFHP